MVGGQIRVREKTMSWYEHNMICWENGTVMGYADIEKIKSIAKKYVERDNDYDKELDELFEQERQLKIKKKEVPRDLCQKIKDLSDKTLSSPAVNILEAVSSGKAYFEGSKGGLWLAGEISNNTSIYRVLDNLGEFFKELVDNNCLYGNIIGFGESEQSGEAEIYMLDKNTFESVKIEKGQKWCWGLDW
jgi:hypothetical protein